MTAPSSHDDESELDRAELPDAPEATGPSPAEEAESTSVSSRESSIIRRVLDNGGRKSAQLQLSSSDFTAPTEQMVVGDADIVKMERQSAPPTRRSIIGGDQHPDSLLRRSQRQGSTRLKSVFIEERNRFRELPESALPQPTPTFPDPEHSEPIGEEDVERAAAAAANLDSISHAVRLHQSLRAIFLLVHGFLAGFGALLLLLVLFAFDDLPLARTIYRPPLSVIVRGVALVGTLLAGVSLLDRFDHESVTSFRTLFQRLVELLCALATLAALFLFSYAFELEKRLFLTPIANTTTDDSLVQPAAADAAFAQWKVLMLAASALVLAPWLYLGLVWRRGRQGIDEWLEDSSA